MLIPAPPILRRIFSSSPLLAPLLLILVIATLILSASPTARKHTLPSSWRGVASPPAADEDLTPLPPLYAASLPSLQLPVALVRYPALASRLHDFLLRPLESAPVAAKTNHESCPLPIADLIVNQDQLEGNRDFWGNLTTGDIAEHRAALVNWLAAQAEAGAEIVGTPQTGSGRGIVITAGNQDTTRRAIILLKQLKHVGNFLPVEVFHYPDELTDAGERAEITSLGGKIVQVTGVTKSEGAWKNWQIKGLAMIQSSFAQLISLDSDNLPLRSLGHLFDAEVVQDTGAAFWPDLSKDHADNAIWRIVGEACTLDQWTFESGQIVVDKRGNDGLNLAALWLAAGMMDDRDWWFRMCGGDKDTYRWAWRVLDIPYATSPRWMSALGFLNPHEGGRFCGHTMLQYDLVTPKGFTEPPPLFVHSNLLKHLGGSTRERGNVFTHIKRMAADTIDDPSLNYAHMHVYTGAGQGMCLDLDMHDTAKQALSEDQLNSQVPLTLEVGELDGQPFKGFEDAFFDAGGFVGGW
ncbi:Alpha-1,2-mannosyltransferase MNN2 [Vanrija pseudolonga]|uniref:Alpha-1,2-mannosyltransferase MNN2 n=1 Tax=Vanrija pseudolonga TaxID=143232 RepID=A0AAF0YF04_9TREE|nr:Alpha-1,2-mannosyltransferase MNN2 [Vanrija pseudolonga]